MPPNEIKISIDPPEPAHKRAMKGIQKVPVNDLSKGLLLVVVGAAGLALAATVIFLVVLVAVWLSDATVESFGDMPEGMPLAIVGGIALLLLIGRGSRKGS